MISYLVVFHDRLFRNDYIEGPIDLMRWDELKWKQTKKKNVVDNLKKIYNSKVMFCLGLLTLYRNSRKSRVPISSLKRSDKTLLHKNIKKIKIVSTERISVKSLEPNS